LGVLKFQVGHYAVPFLVFSGLRRSKSLAQSGPNDLSLKTPALSSGQIASRRTFGTANADRTVRHGGIAVVLVVQFLIISYGGTGNEPCNPAS
jgi:hypothetical protein